MRITLLLLAFLTTFFQLNESHAETGKNKSVTKSTHIERRYYCSDGRVQDRPCTVRAQTKHLKSHKKLSLPKVEHSEAEVLKSDFKKLSNTRGQWSGIVRGKGRVFVKLLIFRNSVLEESRLMGSVVLSSLKSTNFAFRSYLPPGNTWSSKIVAWSERI